jgi:hypothetical protein
VVTPAKIRQRVRIHESGHAIVGRVLGLWDSPYVVASSDGSGQTHFYLPLARARDHMTREEWRTFQESSAISILAGQAGLEVFGDPEPGRGASADREHARTCAESLNPAAPDAEMVRLYQRAIALARANRSAIERLAATLAANGNRLTAPSWAGAQNEVRLALDAAMAGGPTPRFTGARPISRQDFLDQLKEYRTEGSTS